MNDRMIERIFENFNNFINNKITKIVIIEIYITNKII